MNSRAKLLAELEEKGQKNKNLSLSMGELQASEPGPAEGYNPYDNPGVHKSAGIDDTARRRILRRR